MREKPYVWEVQPDMMDDWLRNIYTVPPRPVDKERTKRIVLWQSVGYVFLLGTLLGFMGFLPFFIAVGSGVIGAALGIGYMELRGWKHAP